MTNNAAKNWLIQFYPWAIIIISAITLVYKYIMQVSPSVMTNELMRAFHVYGTGLGNLAATFFYTYLVTQFFVGALLDKFSIRFLTAFALAISAIGTYAFAYADTLTFAFISRALMGIGTGFFTVSYMKLAANWFVPQQFALISGLLATATMVGAIFGEAPLAWLITHHGWRYAIMVTAWFGIITTVLYAFVVRDHPKNKLAVKSKYVITLKDVVKIFTKKQNWILTLYSGITFSPLAAFGGLWGTPFLKEAHHLSLTDAASLISLVFVGLAIGGPFFGYISDCLQNRIHIMLVGVIVSLIAIVLIIYLNITPIWFLGILLFFFGFGTGAFMLGFVIGKEINDIALTATVIAIINTGDAVFGAFTEPLIGGFLDAGWKGKIINGTHCFGVNDFHKAFLLLPCYLVVAIILILFIRDLKHKQ